MWIAATLLLWYRGRMKKALSLVATSLLFLGCSSTPEATEPQATSATAAPSADMAPVPTSEPVAEMPSATPSATPAPEPAPEPASDLAVVAMKITLDPKTTIELKADKGIYLKGKKIASFDKNVLQLTDMKDNLSVWKDGSITSTPSTPDKIRFNDKDELELGAGGKIAIDDKGKVTLTPVEGKKTDKMPRVAITGFKPEARRAAEIAMLLTLLSMSGEAPAKEVPVATAPAKATPAAAPAKSPKK